MKKVWIFLAIIVGLICAILFLPNREEQPSSEVSPETQKVALADKQVQENDGGELSGKVIDGLTKKPLAAKIKVKSGDKVIATTDCNAAGMFAVSLEDGEYEIAIEHPHYVKKGKFDVNRLIEIDGEPVKIDDTELWPEAIVKGRVVSDHQGVEAELQFIYQIDNSGAKHYLFNTIKTDKDGYFTLDNAYGGVQNIRISSDHLVSQKLSDIALKSGETVDLGEIPMNSGLTIFGVVKEDGTEKGISGASVLCVNLNRKIVAETQTADDGAYTLPVIDLNQYRVIVTADGFQSNSALLDAQGQNRYEYNVAMTKFADKKPAQNSVVEPPKNVENNEDQAQQNDESESIFTKEEEIEYKNKIQNVVRDSSEQFSECYQNLLAIEAAAGKIVFDFMSSSSGDVFNITVKNAEINNEEFLDCLTDVIANFHFPKRSDDGLVMIEYPFVFEQGHSEDE
ncbi:MAG: carboxypeptidase regulatory-like domain-containing protein [Proteobacteria bacterium]|nr:carboxypeptidase regulatory-like domain-containing protein [Pseudomonadota bacterium]